MIAQKKIQSINRVGCKLRRDNVLLSGPHLPLTNSFLPPNSNVTRLQIQQQTSLADTDNIREIRPLVLEQQRSAASECLSERDKLI